MYFDVALSDKIKMAIITNIDNNVIVIPYPSNKNLAIINVPAPQSVDTIARVDNTVPRSDDLML